MILAELGRPCLLVPTNQSWVDFFSADAPLRSAKLVLEISTARGQIEDLLLRPMGQSYAR